MSCRHEGPRAIKGGRRTPGRRAIGRRRTETPLDDWWIKDHLMGFELIAGRVRASTEPDGGTRR
jgi:hypothetical protein